MPGDEDKEEIVTFKITTTSFSLLCLPCSGTYHTKGKGSRPWYDITSVYPLLTETTYELNLACPSSFTQKL